MSEVQKTIGKSAINKRTQKKLKFYIADGAVTGSKIADGAVTPEKISPRYKEEVINPLLKQLQHEIDGIVMHGIAVSTEFGDDPFISVSQKTLTEGINKIWSKLEEITGKPLRGISMDATPDFFYGNEAVVHISATSEGAPGLFEHIAFYADGELIAEAENVESLDCDYTITGTTTIKCKAKILGVDDYMKEKTITRYNSFWLGAGSGDTEYIINHIMNPEHSIDGELKGPHDVTVGTAPYNHIIIVIDEGSIGAFIRADMNGFEIPFYQTEPFAFEGNPYVAFISSNAYMEGEYNMDINS